MGGSAKGAGSAFRAAVEAGDIAAAQACLADDVVFRSPVAHKPYEGKAITAAILANVFEVFEDLRYVRELEDANGHALVFEAIVDGLQLTGCDFIVLDDAGQIAEFMVMVRPLKAAHALADRMASRFDRIVEQASGS
ncbi:nuclear transport factor 2 family protein [Nocardioides albidus]|uniref:Nuclear transport factor 2 family protein n=1 Tax=Nocardioides albidus TaxID=1517589 RepID=A0A5C4WIR8_9ACTN|nr:nuclear transport factor 2 family protein [Nocardioides albidus]TNM47229.1 nuclear transport factor 2 family protein [Nocardioides albidus]